MTTVLSNEHYALGYYEIDLPTYWACYLINCDCSGMEDNEIKMCDERTANLGRCVDVSEESFFGRYAGIGYDLSTYIFHIEPTAK